MLKKDTALMRLALQFAYDVVAGAVAHIILMIAGLILSMALFGKMDEGPKYLLAILGLPFSVVGSHYVSQSCFDNADEAIP